MLQLWIGVIAALIMAGGLLGVFYLIVKQHMPMNTKMIQLLAIVFVLPLVLILGIYNFLGKDIVGTIIGVIIGFVFSNFSKD